ncbi:hypothetical protein [Nocardioides pakistanensis]
MSDNLDVDLNDAELIAEIELVTELMVLASESGPRLDQAAIDAVLGVAAPRQVVPMRTAPEIFIPQQRAV